MWLEMNPANEKMCQKRLRCMDIRMVNIYSTGRGIF